MADDPLDELERLLSWQLLSGRWSRAIKAAIRELKELRKLKARIDRLG